MFSPKSFEFFSDHIFRGPKGLWLLRFWRLKIGPYRELAPTAIRSQSSQVPFGWQLDQGELKEHPEEWKWVVEMHQLRQAGQSLHKITGHLTGQKVATKNGSNWHAKTVSQILDFNAEHLQKKRSTRR